MQPSITVDVWSDIACPWCFIGKRRLEDGLRSYATDDDALPVQVVYHSYELSPDTPVDFEGSSADFLAQRKGLAPDQVQQMLAQVTQIAAGVGLAYDMPAVRQTRTFKAHQLTHLARARGLQPEMVERLFSAHFEQGRHVGRDDELADLAADVGLDREEVIEALREGTHADDVQADIAQAGAYGITAVPYVVIDSRYAVSGAQEAAVFERALRQAATDRAVAGG